MKSKLFILILAASISFFFTSCGCRSKKSKETKKIEVTGSAEMEVVPDQIFVNFTLKEYMEAAKKKVKLDAIKTEFLKLCKDAGIADSNISISSYNGNESYDYNYYKKRKEEPDFMSSISYTIKVASTDKLDKIVSGMNEDAIENFYISKTSHSNIEQLRKQVKIKALLATKEKAEYLANSIGEKLGEALFIQEIADNSGYGNYYSNPVSNTTFSNEDNNKMESENTTSTNFQKIKLRYEMKAEFRLK